MRRRGRVHGVRTNHTIDEGDRFRAALDHGCRTPVHPCIATHFLTSLFSVTMLFFLFRKRFRPFCLVKEDFVALLSTLLRYEKKKKIENVIVRCDHSFPKDPSARSF